MSDHAMVVLVGEQPGDREDREGQDSATTAAGALAEGQEMADVEAQHRE